MTLRYGRAAIVGNFGGVRRESIGRNEPVRRYRERSR